MPDHCRQIWDLWLVWHREARAEIVPECDAELCACLIEAEKGVPTITTNKRSASSSSARRVAKIAKRLEYLYYGLDNVALTGPISPGSFLPVTFTWSNYSVQVVRASLSYKF